MRIEIPEIKQHEGRHATTAKITVDNNAHTFPDELWFSLRGDDEYQYPTLSDAFLIAMLPIAMKLGEPIRVEGPVSERLAYGLEAYQSILNCWWPDLFNIVEVDYVKLVSRRNDLRPEGVGCCFSGGLDSFYAVLRHLPGQQRLNAYQLTHALMINRFDQIAGFEGEGTSSLLYENYRPVLEKWGVKLLVIDSNLRLFRQPAFHGVEIVRSFNSTLSACAHVLSSLFGRFIIPGQASFSHADLYPCGANPVMDHHLGTDQLQIIHHAEGTVARKDKIEFIVDNPVVQQHLHVCYGIPTFDEETGRVLNCCKCVKCLRILITLELMGKIKPFKTFPYRHDKSYFNKPEKISKVKDHVLHDLIHIAKKVNNKEWICILDKALRIKEETEFDKQLGKAKSFKNTIRAAVNHIVPGD